MPITASDFTTMTQEYTEPERDQEQYALEQRLVEERNIEVIEKNRLDDIINSLTGHDQV